MKNIILPSHFYFIGASNPYREISSKQNSKIKVGLRNISSESQLVYKVNKFPSNIDDYIWDYGTLSHEQSFLYICSILKDLTLINMDPYLVHNLVYQSHKYINDNDFNARPNFNKFWLRLVYGRNIIKVEGDCDIDIITQYKLALP